MATTPYSSFINGSPGQSSYQSVFQVGSKLKLGTDNSTYKVYRICSGYMADVNVAVSKGEQFKKVFTAYIDRAPAKASGYSPLGVATFGSGKNPISTTWARDYAVYSGSVTYAVENGREKKFYSQLAT